MTPVTISEEYQRSSNGCMRTLDMEKRPSATLH